MYDFSESELTDDNWNKIAEGLLKVAKEQGILDEKRSEAIDLQVKTQQYKNTLEYIKYKLEAIITNNNNNKN